MPQTKQPWKQTGWEVATNIIVGFIVAALGNWVYLWWFDIHVSLGFLTGLGVFMTFISIVRQIVVRRIFEHIRIITSHVRPE